MSTEHLYRSTLTIYLILYGKLYHTIHDDESGADEVLTRPSRRDRQTRERDTDEVGFELALPSREVELSARPNTVG